MEVKSIYLDLQKAELNKRGKKSVWKLESEAFKEPLELKIGYEDKELEEFKQMVKELKTDLNNKDSKIYELESKLDASNRVIGDLQKDIERQKEANISLWVQIQGNESEISQLYKTIWDLKQTVEMLSGTILQLQEWMRLINQKLTKQPMVFSDKTFISGHERVGLWLIEIPSGEYLVISKYDVGECNEYVMNENDIVMEKTTVNDNCYIPYYKLVGWTDLDVPTATIHWTLTFIPC